MRLFYFGCVQCTQTHCCGCNNKPTKTVQKQKKFHEKKFEVQFKASTYSRYAVFLFSRLLLFLLNAIFSTRLFLVQRKANEKKRRVFCCYFSFVLWQQHWTSQTHIFNLLQIFCILISSNLCTAFLQHVFVYFWLNFPHLNGDFPATWNSHSINKGLSFIISLFSLQQALNYSGRKNIIDGFKDIWCKLSERRIFRPVLLSSNRFCKRTTKKQRIRSLKNSSKTRREKQQLVSKQALIVKQASMLFICTMRMHRTKEREFCRPENAHLGFHSQWLKLRKYCTHCIPLFLILF